MKNYDNLFSKINDTISTIGGTMFSGALVSVFSIIVCVVIYILLPLGGIIWLIAAVFDRPLIDQAGSVSRFFGAIIFLIYSIINIIALIKRKKLKKSYLITCIIIWITFLIYGITNQYNSLIANYDYTKMSGIIMTLCWGAILSNILEPIFLNDLEITEKFSKMLNPIKIYIGLLVLTFFITQGIAGIMSFKNEEAGQTFFNTICYYDHKGIKSKREKWEFNSIEEASELLLKDFTKQLKDGYKSKEELTTEEEKIKYALKKDGFLGELYKKYDFSVTCKIIDETVAVYMVHDYQYLDNYYYKVDYRGDITIEKIDCEYYKDAKKVK